jgi:hypothetical protein
MKKRARRNHRPGPPHRTRAGDQLYRNQRRSFRQNLSPFSGAERPDLCKPKEFWPSAGSWRRHVPRATADHVSACMSAYLSTQSGRQVDCIDLLSYLNIDGLYDPSPLLDFGLEQGGYFGGRK